MSLYTCIYVPNVYIDMRRTVIVIYVLQSSYSIKCKPIYEVVHDQSSLRVWDCQVVILESVINNMENVFQLNNKLLTCLFNHSLFCFFEHILSYLNLIKTMFNLSVSNAATYLHSENWYKNSVCWLCCLSAGSDSQTSFLVSLSHSPSVCQEGLRVLVDLKPLILF